MISIWMKTEMDWRDDVHINLAGLKTPLIFALIIISSARNVILD